MNQSFEIIIGSPVNYDELVAYIVVDGKEVALLSQDRGKEKLEIVFAEENVLRRVNFDLFTIALSEAKRRLLR